jgi:hypothetical protein
VENIRSRIFDFELGELLGCQEYDSGAWGKGHSAESEGLGTGTDLFDLGFWILIETRELNRSYCDHYSTNQLINHSTFYCQRQV